MIFKPEKSNDFISDLKGVVLCFSTEVILELLMGSMLGTESLEMLLLGIPDMIACFGKIAG